LHALSIYSHAEFCYNRGSKTWQSRMLRPVDLSGTIVEEPCYEGTTDSI
jgi:hypothetical protein